MQVILLEKVRNLGGLGDKVAVKPGYGRNFLVPQGKAVYATKENISLFESKRAEFEKKAQANLVNAEQRAAKINDITLIIEAQASDEGKLYGSVSANEICEGLIARSIEIQRREIMMPEGPIHSTGQFEIDVLLHSDVVAKLKLEVVAAK